MTHTQNETDAASCHVVFHFTALTDQLFTITVLFYQEGTKVAI